MRNPTSGYSADAWVTSANWVRSGGKATCGEEEEKAKFSGVWGVNPANLEIE